MLHRTAQFYLMLLILLVAQNCPAQESAERRRDKAMQFHRRAQERTGLLIPMYVYPENIHTNPVYNRLIELKRRFEMVPMWVIVNPASGPGTAVDANYTKAIDRLQGAGCVTLGYIATNYSKKSASDVQAEIRRWQQLYPRIQGIFFDEMIYENTDAGVNYQVTINQAARDAGCWPTVANPGTDTPGRYFAADAADVIVVHEGDQWPNEQRMKGDYFGGYSDYPPFTRAVLIHSLPKLDPKSLTMVRKYARWIYVTDDPYRLNDPKADNPWDTLSKHMETLCEELARRDGPRNQSGK